MAMRSLGYMPSEVELAIIMQRLDMDGETQASSLSPDEPPLISETFDLKGPALGVKRRGFMSWLTFEEKELGLDHSIQLLAPAELVLGPREGTG